MKKTGLVGIYKIVCEEQQLIYIGQSTNLIGRLKQHKSCLVNSKHPNKMLQKDFKNFSFNFEIIEHCDNDELLHKETWWIDFYVKKGFYMYNKILDTVNSHKLISVHPDYYKILNRTYDLLLSKQLSINYLDEFLISI
jgi:group I intron endonuclease